MNYPNQQSNPFNKPDTALDSFAPRILKWFETNGRHSLPWQQHQKTTPDPYPVWLSEVMLQQTQVNTVIPYFQRFIKSFPSVQELANADWQQIAEHWAGLGYYARARNLHKGAKQLTQIIEQTGNFPQTVNEWQQISGVGQSTAGAVVAMGVRGFGVICDGNVKRVLTRWSGNDGDINKTATNKILWQLAERLTPKQHSGNYAQAMMDMGATLCTKNKPACLLCPVQNDCTAHAQGKETAYPIKSKKAKKPNKYSQALKITNPQQQTLWLQRPDNGIWGGLWCLPLQFQQKTLGKKILANHLNDQDFENEYTTAEQIIYHFLQTLAQTTDHIDNPIKHSLTHFHWYINPITLTLTDTQTQHLNNQLDHAQQNYQWLNPTQSKTIAQPKAMQKLHN